jgi:hypothetical protein
MTDMGIALGLASRIRPALGAKHHTFEAQSSQQVMLP